MHPVGGFLLKAAVGGLVSVQIRILLKLDALLWYTILYFHVLQCPELSGVGVQLARHLFYFTFFVGIVFPTVCRDVLGITPFLPRMLWKAHFFAVGSTYS